MTKDEVLALVKKNPIGVGCGVVSVLLAAGIYFRGAEMPAAEEELAQKSSEASRLAANIQNAAQLKEQVEALAAANKEVETRLVRASQTLNNYQFFYKLESETGAKMTVLNQGPAGAPKGAVKSAFIPVARLSVEPQNAWPVGGPTSFDETLSFSPWNGLAAHRPLGSVNRVRQVAYPSSADARSARSRCPIREPRRVDM